MTETIKEIPPDELHPFPDHPFGVRDDDAMQQTVESIKVYGVVVLAIARLREDGGYEIIAGHRRKHDCELVGLKTMPVIIRDLDSNLQRENILPSEKAKAYLLDKSILSIRLQPPYSEERRQKSSENTKQNGFNSQTE